jgi:hypothetical protein
MGADTFKVGFTAGFDRRWRLHLRVGSKKYVIRNLTESEAQAAVSTLRSVTG